MDVHTHRRVQPFFISEQIEHALVGFGELLIRMPQAAARSSSLGWK